MSPELAVASEEPFVASLKQTIASSKQLIAKRKTGYHETHTRRKKQIVATHGQKLVTIETFVAKDHAMSACNNVHATTT